MKYLRVIWQVISAPIRLLLQPRLLLQLSVPMRAALSAFILMVLVVVVAYLVVRKEAALEQRWLNNWPWMVGLVLLIPFATYYAVKLWLEGVVSPYEDIDRAWQAGLADLGRSQIDIRQTALFFVIGAPGESQVSSLFRAAQVSLSVDRIPPGPAPLHWYANPERIFVVFHDVGCLSWLAEQAGKPGGFADLPGSSGGGGIINTLSPGEVSDLMRGKPSAATPPPAPQKGRMDAIRQTLDISQIKFENDLPTAAPVAAAGRRVDLPSHVVQRQSQRLHYVCQLARRARDPICPLNGVLALLPWSLMLADDAPGREGALVAEAARVDAAALVKGLAMRCPVVALVTGMEEVSGFHELVRRVGRDRSGQKFGKGFGVGDLPVREEVEALCKHACGAFEKWSYHLFREKHAVGSPGNRSLYSLLSKTRRYVAPRLDTILVRGFSCDDGAELAEPLLFSGCYFAATGETEDRQAYVKQVFDKLQEEAADLVWTRAASSADGRYAVIATVGWITSAVFAVAAAYFVYVRLIQK